jgi:hypothetical protein
MYFMLYIVFAHNNNNNKLQITNKVCLPRCLYREHNK